MDWLERFAWLMDEQWRVPGTKIRLGLDGLIGILPVGGDIATGVAQACFVLVAQHTFNLPKRVVHRMAANVAVDLVVGAIPLLGDLFDIHFKANKRNLALIKEHLQGYPDV
jgi:hypothetical protein